MTMPQDKNAPRGRDGRPPASDLDITGLCRIEIVAERGEAQQRHPECHLDFDWRSSFTRQIPRSLLERDMSQVASVTVNGYDNGLRDGDVAVLEFFRTPPLVLVKTTRGNWFKRLPDAVGLLIHVLPREGQTEGAGSAGAPPPPEQARADHY